jgi:hypothetical protein
MGDPGIGKYAFFHECVVQAAAPTPIFSEPFLHSLI